MLCDTCGKPATVHMTKIVGGKKTEFHFCDKCSEGQGKPGPVEQEMETFVTTHLNPPDIKPQA